MLIKTETFNVTKKELRNLIAGQYYKLRKNLLIFYPLLIIVNTLVGLNNDFNRFVTFSLILILIMNIIAPFTWNFKKLMPVANFISRYWEFDENFLFVYYEDGSTSKFRFEHLVYAIKTKKYYLLYLTAAGQFHYIPIAAFESEKDIHRFDLLLEGKQLMKLWK